MKLSMLHCLTVAAALGIDAFIGPAFLHRAGSSETDLALQPSIASAYHFGPWFLSADARAYVIPSPGTLGLLVGGGAGF